MARLASKKSYEFVQQQSDKEYQVDAKEQQGTFHPFRHLHIRFGVLFIDLSHLGEVV
jgi:hypothetical protein